MKPPTKRREPIFGPNAIHVVWQLALGLVLLFLFSYLYDRFLAGTVNGFIDRLFQ